MYLTQILILNLFLSVYVCLFFSKSRNCEKKTWVSTFGKKRAHTQRSKQNKQKTRKKEKTLLLIAAHKNLGNEKNIPKNNVSPTTDKSKPLQTNKQRILKLLQATNKQRILNRTSILFFWCLYCFYILFFFWKVCFTSVCKLRFIRFRKLSCWAKN